MPPTVLAPKPVETKPVRKEQVSSPKGFQGFDIYGWLVAPQKFNPVAFFVGIVIAVVACACAGRAVAKQNIYNNFHRFHDYISPASLYYPTISQMIAIVESQSKPDQTIVVVGGNSVFYGLGQNEEELWSTQLQKQLGSKFAVFNFANPSSEPFEWGYWTAEALLKRHRKVIYVTIAVPGKVGKAAGSDVYGYGYWDAREKHLLVNDKIRDMKVAAYIKDLSEKDKIKIAEVQMRSKMDSILYYQDLWTAVAYKNFFTVWTHLTASNPLAPHSAFKEDRVFPGPVEGRFKSDVDLASIKSYCKSYFDYNTCNPKALFWYQLMGEMFSLIPQQYKQNCLVVVSTHTPAYIDRLNETEKTRERLSGTKSVETWTKAGYHSINLAGKVNNEDFLDARHLIASGGTKVSGLVAEQVLKINSELKY